MADFIEVISTTASVVQVNTVGPQGPAGTPGATGPAGPAGADAANSLYASSVGNSVMSTPVGGAISEPASTWKTRTIAAALDTILFPTILPFVSTPKSVTLAVSDGQGTSTVVEVGRQLTRTLTATFNRGRITNGDGTLGPQLVGPAMSFSYTGTTLGAPIVTGSTATLTNALVVLGPNSWTVSVINEPGTGQYFDNKGNASTALDSQRDIGPLGANQVTAVSSPAITGVYPWFYLKSPVSFTPTQFAAAITAGNATNIHASAVLSKVVADASGTLSIPYNVNGQFLGVAYESTLTTKTKYYVTALDNGPITAIFNAMAQNPSVPTSLWVSGYKFHITPTPLTNSNPTLELRNV